MRRWNETDIRDVLPTITVPTLCLARSFDDGTEEAEYITGPDPRCTARGASRERSVHRQGDQDALGAAIREFVGVTRRGRDTETILRAVLFTDVVDSTALSARLGDVAWRDLIERHHSLVRAALSRHGGTEEDTAGDGFFATFDGPARAVRCAREIVDAIAPLGIQVRAGVHAGECQVIDRQTGGITVAIGARVAAAAGPSQVFVSQTVKDLTAGSGLDLEDAGDHELKGVPDHWQLYRVAS